MNISGETFVPELDGPRLESQLKRVEALMIDCEWRTLRDIADKVQGSEAGASARLRDLRNKMGYTVLRRRRGYPESGLFEYQVSITPNFQKVFDFHEKI